MKMEGSLSKYPDSPHWHFKEGTQERGGTLRLHYGEEEGVFGSPSRLDGLEHGPKMRWQN